MDSVTRVPGQLEPPEAHPLAGITASWQRLGSRVEGLVNRGIDDVADAAERALVPALVGGVQAFFEGRAAGPASRPAPSDGTAALLRENTMPAHGSANT
jgi:hypothetical protein